MDSVGKIIFAKFFKGEDAQKYEHMLREVLGDPEIQAFLAQHQDEIDEDGIAKSVSRLYEYFQVKAKLKQGDERQTGGYTPNLRISNHMVEIYYAPTAYLRAKQAARKKDQRFKVFNMPKNTKQANLDDFAISGQHGQRLEAYTAVLEFASQVIENPQVFTKGIYLQGSFGIGKTFLMAGMANYLVEQGVQVTMVNYPSFVVDVKNALSDNTTSLYINKVKNAQVLVLDDIGADQSSSWVRDEVLGVILQYRMQEQLPTCFTSNLSMQQLQEEYLAVNNRGEKEPLKARRIMERVRFLAREITMEDQNWRNPETNVSYEEPDYPQGPLTGFEY